MQNQFQNEDKHNEVPPSLVLVEKINYSDIPELADYRSPRTEAERLLNEFPVTTEGELSKRLSLFILLTDLYIGENCFEAAREAMRRAEPIFFNLVRNSTDWVDPCEVTFVIDRYCQLEQFGDARRMARQTMDVLKQRADYETGDEMWLLDTWLHDILYFESRHRARTDAIKQSPQVCVKKTKRETNGLTPVMAGYFELAFKVNET